MVATVAALLLCHSVSPLHNQKVSVASLTTHPCKYYQQTSLLRCSNATANFVKISPFSTRMGLTCLYLWLKSKSLLLCYCVPLLDNQIISNKLIHKFCYRSPTTYCLQV